MLFSTADVIKHRKNEIFNLTQDIEQNQMEISCEIAELQAQIAHLENKSNTLSIRKQMLIQEADLLDTVDHGKIIVSNPKTRTRVETHAERMNFEDAIKDIFEQSAGILSIGDLIDKLERYGYTWSRYQKAYYEIKKIPEIQPVPGTRGFVQFMRPRF